MQTIDAWTDQVDVDTYVQFTDKLFVTVKRLADEGAWEAAEKDALDFLSGEEGRSSHMYCSACRDLKMGVRSGQQHNFGVFPHNLREYEHKFRPWTPSTGPSLHPLAHRALQRNTLHLDRCEACRNMYLAEVKALEDALV